MQANKAEELLKEYENVCKLQVGLPIWATDVKNPRSLMRKIKRLKGEGEGGRMAVLEELLPVAMEMARRECRGVWRLSNPGGISQEEMGEMYRKYIDPGFEWESFDLEEESRKKRVEVEVEAIGNGMEDGSKLKTEFPQLLPIKDSLIKHLFQPNAKP